MPSREPIECLIANSSSEHILLPNERLKTAEYYVFYADSKTAMTSLPQEKLAESYYDEKTDSLIIESFTDKPIHLQLDHTVKKLQIRTKGKVHITGKLSVSEQFIVEADMLSLGDSVTETLIKCQGNHAVQVNHWHILGDTKTQLLGDSESICRIENKLFVEDSRAVFSLKNTLLDANLIENKGDFYFANGLLNAERLEQNRILDITESEIVVSKEIIQSQKTLTKIKKSTTEIAQTVINGGTFSVEETKYLGDHCKVFSGKMELKNGTDFYLNESLLFGENTKLSIEKSSLHVVDEALIFGETTLTEAFFEGNAFKAKKPIKSVKSKIKAETLEMAKGADLSDTKLYGHLVKLKGEFETSDLMIYANNMHFSSENSHMKNAIINTNLLTLNGSKNKDDLVFDSSLLSAKVYNINHHVTAQNHSSFIDVSDASTELMSQDITGQLTLKKSTFISENVVHDFPESKVELLENSRFYSGTSYSEGDISLQQSRALASNLLKTGNSLNLDMSTFQVKQKAFLHNSEVKLKQKSSFSAPQMILGAGTTTRVTEKSSLIARHMEMQAGSETVLQGAATCKAQNLKLAGELVVEKDKNHKSAVAQLMVDEQFDITDSAYISGDGNLNALAETTHKEGDIDLQGKFSLKGKNFSNNAGQFDADNIFLGCDQYIANYADMHAKSLVMHSPFIGNIFGQITADKSLETAGLFSVNLGGAIWANNYTNNSLASLNAGLVLPNFSSGVDSVFSWQNMQTVANQVINPLAPTAMKAINFATMLPSLVSKVGSAYSAISSFDYGTYTSMRTHEWIPMICEAKNMAMFGASMYRSTSEICSSSFDNGCEEVAGLTWDKAVNHCSNFDWTETGVGILGGHYNENTLIHANIGASLATNTAKSSLYHYNTGMEYSAGAHNISTRYMHNQGYTGGTYASYYTDTINNAGYMRGASRLSVKAKTFNNLIGSTLTGEQISAQIGIFNNNGSVDLSKGKMDLDRIIQSESGDLKLNQMSVAVKDDSAIQGSYDIVNSALDFENNATFSGDGKLKESTIKANETLTVQGQSEAESCVLIGKHVDVKGLTASDGKIQAQGGHLSMKDTTTLDTSIGAKSAELEDCTLKGRVNNAEKPNEANDAPSEKSPEVMASEEQSESNQVNIDEDFKTTRTTIENMAMAIGGDHQDDSGTYRNVQETVQGNYSGKDTDLNHANVTANNVSFSGEHSSSTDSIVVAQETISQTGHMEAEKSHFESKNMTWTGLQAKECELEAEQKMDIQNSETMDTYLKSDVMHLKKSAFRSSQPLASFAEESSESQHPSPEENKEALENTSVKPTINAITVLKAEEVIFEGQSVRAGNMKSKNTTINQSSVEVDKEDFTAKNLTANGANISAVGNVSLKEKISMIESNTTAGKNIFFEKNADVYTNNASYTAAKNIEHSAKHQQEGLLAFKAHTVETTQASSISSVRNDAQTDPNVLHVKADNANFAGHKDIDHGVIDAKHITHLRALIAQTGQSEKQTFSESLSITTDQEVSFEKGMKPRDCDLEITASAIQVNAEYQSKHLVSLAAREGNVDINNNISGEKVLITSEKAHVNVTGCEVRGKIYVGIDAAKQVNLTATEETYHGKHDVEKNYVSASIIGGRGDESTQGIGAYVRGNNVNIDASHVKAKGDVVVYAKKNVRFGAKKHTYIAEKWKEKKKLGWGKREYERTEAKVWSSTIKSGEGRINVFAEKGNIEGDAVKFKGVRGADVWAKHDIRLRGIKTRTKIYEKNSKWFGLSSDKRSKENENIEYTKFEAKKGDVRLHADIGNIDGKDTQFHVNGNLAFEAPKNSIRIKNSKLKHHIKTSARKASISAPIVDTAKDIFSGNVKGVFRKVDPVVGKTEKLRKSKKSGEIASSAFNAGIHGYNTYNALMQGNYAQQMAQNLGWVPKVNLGLTETKTSLDYQTVADGGIACTGTVSFDCKNTLALKSIPIVAKNLRMDAKHIRIKSHKLKTRQRVEKKSVSIGVTPAGISDVSASYGKNKTKATHYSHTQIQVAGTVTINAKTASIGDTTIICNAVEGNVDKLEIISHQDTLDIRDVNAAASSTGFAAFQESHTSSKKMGQQSGIHANNLDNFHVGKAYLKDATVTAETGDGFQPEKIVEKQSKDSVHTRGWGIAGDINAVRNFLQSSPDEQKLQSESGKNSSPRIETVAISYQTDSQNIALDIPTNAAQVLSHSGVGFFKAPAKTNTSSTTVKKFESNEGTYVAADIQTEESKFGSENLEGEYYSPLVIPEILAIGSSMETSGTVTQPQFPSDNLTEENYLTHRLPEEPEEYVDVSMDISQPREAMNDNNSPKTNHWMQAVLPEEQQTEEEKTHDTFNPSLDMREMGFKSGAHNETRLYQASSGQYTSVQKELGISQKNSHYSFDFDAEITLFEGGESGNGFYYNAHIDPLERQLIVHGEFGKQYRFNLYANNTDIGALGNVSYCIDAGSFSTFLGGNIEITPTSAAVLASGEFGLMGPSLGVQYQTSEWSFMGFSMKTTIEADTGVGLKAAGEIGAKADAKRLKLGLVAKVGFFAGAGAQARVKIEPGVHMEFFEEYPKAFKEIVEDDAMMMSILTKKKNWMHCEEWENDYFDAVMDKVMPETQLRCWKK